MATAWTIWRNRNLVVWEGNGVPPATTIHNVAWAVAEWKEVRLPVESIRVADRGVAWHKLRLGFVKINIDASFFEESLQTGAGMVLRYAEGKLLAFRTLIRDGYMRVDEGKAWGILEAIRWATMKGLRNVIVETDAQRVCEAYAGNEPDDSLFGDFIAAGKRIMVENSLYQVQWVRRNANIVTHILARAARRFESPYNWDKPPDFVNDLLDWCNSCM